MDRTLVTGGAGFVGSHLVESLVELGNEVTVLDDLSNGRIENLSRVKRDITFIKKDVSKPLGGLFDQKYKTIYHLACWPRSRSFADPKRDVEVNIIGMVNVLELARKDRAQVIFSSNSGIYKTSIPIDESSPDDPKTPYDLDKLQAENYLKLYNRTYDVPYVIFRFATVYGSRQQVSEEWRPVVMEFIKKMQNGEPPTIYWDGEQTRDFIYVSDIIDALILALKNNEAIGETMILGSGKETSINQLYRAVSNILGVNIEPIHKPKQLGDIARMRYNCEKAEKILGWKANISLEEGVKRILKK